MLVVWGEEFTTEDAEDAEGEKEGVGGPPRRIYDMRVTEYLA